MTEPNDPRPFLRRHRRMSSALRASPEDLAARRATALRAVLTAASGAEPYRSTWPEAPWDALDPLAALPIVDRDAFYPLTLRERLAPGAIPEVRLTTSGTGGRPLEVALSVDENVTRRALQARQLRAAGIPAGRSLVLQYGGWRLDPLVVRGARATIGGLAPPQALVDAVRSIRPTVLAGTPTSLLELGDLLGGYRVRGLFTGGEVLDEVSRRDLRAAFGAEPLDAYGAWEFGNTSWECPAHAGYHMNADTHIVEVVGEDDRSLPPGMLGELVITNLWNRTTPFVRYRIGDLGTLLPEEACPCGVTLPRMGSIVGRSNDWVIAADGRRVSPFRVLPSMLGARWTEAMRRFRVIQRAPTDFVLEVAWRDEPRPDLVDALREAQGRAVGAPVSLEVREVPEGWDARAGKFRVVESLVGRPAVSPPA